MRAPKNLSALGLNSGRLNVEVTSGREEQKFYKKIKLEIRKRNVIHFNQVCYRERVNLEGYLPAKQLME